ncbi:uncharacterized protein LOC119263308 [Pygocentrus nattereri]|uniref:uncharacterized protein LOC119263308 n=1 Tax=Pygocentrus nattereri TaxID=42514 RepID=UPI001891BD39|nr:uncharacterized protein LOC119263308 [Pygocentrus nattereri]
MYQHIEDKSDNADSFSLFRLPGTIGLLRTEQRIFIQLSQVDVLMQFGWYLRERMQEISLDLDFQDQEQKMYVAGALNNLFNMKVCNNLKDLLTGPPVSPQATTMQRPEGLRSINQETTNTGSLSATRLADASSAEDYEDRHSDISHTKAHSILIIIFMLSLALILLASLALSAYVLYLIAQSNEKIEDFSRSQQLHRKYLEEIREWKTIIQQVLNHSTALQAK